MSKVLYTIVGIFYLCVACGGGGGCVCVMHDVFFFFFDVLLTVHLSIILTINQLNAQKLL